MASIIKRFWKTVEKNDKKRITSQTPPNISEDICDVDYVGDGNVYHKYDVYRPKNAQGKLPVIVDIHGGGWYYGDKEINKYFCQSLTEYGFAVINVSYRLCPDTDIKGQIQDCFCALNHALDRVEEYGIDSRNVFLAGDSAGGHIVGIMSNVLHDARLQEIYGVKATADVNAICLICPACEPQNMFGALGKVYFNAVLGKGYRKRNTEKIASFEHTLGDNKRPCFFITAHADMLKKDTVRAYELLKERSVETELFYGKKNDNHKLEHVFNVLRYEWNESRCANKAMCDFFLQHLK